MKQGARFCWAGTRTPLVTSVSSAPLADDRFVIPEGWKLKKNNRTQSAQRAQSPLFFAVFAAFAFKN